MTLTLLLLMTFTMAKTGFIELDEGRLFWKCDSPVHYEDSAQSDRRSRPVLLFIHVNPHSDLLLPLHAPFGVRRTPRGEITHVLVLDRIHKLENPS